MRNNKSLVKIYHETNLHRRILRNICLHVELLHNENDFEISEYDIQAIMSQFMKKSWINKDFKVYREAFGKFDCAIAKRGENIPLILYEIKTYLKNKESFLNKSSETEIFKDFEKLSKYMHINVRRYFLIVCNKKHIDKLKKIKGFDWFRSHFNNSRQRKNIGGIRIRPSTKDTVLNTFCLSWEIMKTRAGTPNIKTSH